MLLPAPEAQAVLDSNDFLLYQMDTSDYWTLGLSFLLGIVASLIASFTWYKMFLNHQIQKNRKAFSRLEGVYEHFKASGQKVEGTQSTIEFASPNILTIKSHSKKGHNWQGKIIMSELIPSSGAGYFEYEYPDRASWGSISIQVKEDESEILVHSIHKEMQEQVRVGYIMKKVDPA